MKVRFVVLLSLVAASLPVAPATAGAESTTRSPKLVRAIEALKRETNELRRVSGKRPLHGRFLHRQTGDGLYRLWVRAVWESRLSAARDGLEVPRVWRRLAVCETGGDWRHRNSLYQGGLGFYYGSWDAYRPRGFPAEAYLATPGEQVVVGKRIREDVGWGAWPACSIRLGLR